MLLVGHQKGRNFRERSENFFGCAHPEGYRKALLKMRMAAKYHLPIICLIDTPGAYPGIGAEERGQAQVIAENMFAMSRLATPIICVVIGEGGSGGALGIVLTGMGRDGAEGARRLVEAGGSVMAQDELSSAVWGMPRAVADAGLACAVLPPEKLARRVASRAEGGSCK